MLQFSVFFLTSINLRFLCKRQWSTLRSATAKIGFRQFCIHTIIFIGHQVHHTHTIDFTVAHFSKVCGSGRCRCSTNSKYFRQMDIWMDYKIDIYIYIYFYCWFWATKLFVTKFMLICHVSNKKTASKTTKIISKLVFKLYGHFKNFINFRCNLYCSKTPVNPKTRFS